MAIAIWDQLLSRIILSNNPMAYREAKIGKAFSSTIFWGWILRSFIHGIILYFISHFSLLGNVSNNTGKTHGLWYFSTIIYYNVVLLPTCFIIFELHNISLLTILALFLPFSSVFLFTWIMNEFLYVD